MTCGNCGFPLPENRNGCRHFGTSIAHQEYECVDLLQREIAALREEIARRDELMVRDLAELRSQRTEIAALREAVKDFLCECALVDKFRQYETWQITPWSMDELMKMVEEEP